MPAVYAATKIFHFREKIEDLKSGRWSPPIHVRLKPTNTCNHRCRYCCYRNPDLYLGQRMRETDALAPELLRSIIDDMAEMGVRAVTFSGGGEPLCYPHMEEALQRLVARDIRVALLTNGSRLRGAVAEQLARRATWVRVSLDAADGPSMARRRGVSPDEFDRICANIAAFAAAPERVCVLGVNYIVTPENCADLGRFLARMKDLGVDHVKVSEAVVSVSRRDNVEYVRGMYATIRDQLDAARDRLVDESFALVDKVLDPASVVSSEDDAYVRTYTRCPFAECLTVIGADGCVYTCQDKAYTNDGLVGSLEKTTFRELWSSDRTRERIRSLDPSRVCRHHCVAHAKNRMLLDFLDADPDHLAFV